MKMDWQKQNIRNKCAYQGTDGWFERNTPISFEKTNTDTEISKFIHMKNEIQNIKKQIAEKKQNLKDLAAWNKLSKKRKKKMLRKLLPQV